MKPPPPPPLAPLPRFRDQRAVDREHLARLAYFHFVVAGLALVGIALLMLHRLSMRDVFNNPDIWKHLPARPSTDFSANLERFYVKSFIFLSLAAVGHWLSALFLRRRKNRIFSLIVAGLDCLQFPLGTVLGAFTILVLVRKSVVELYKPAAQPPTSTI